MAMLAISSLLLSSLPLTCIHLIIQTLIIIDIKMKFNVYEALEIRMNFTAVSLHFLYSFVLVSCCQKTSRIVWTPCHEQSNEFHTFIIQIV